MNRMKFFLNYLISSISKMYNAIFSFISSLLICLYIFTKLNFKLEILRDRAIGITVINGIDANKRTHAFIILIIIFSILYLFFCIISDYIIQKVGLLLENQNFDKFIHRLNGIGVILILNFILLGITKDQNLIYVIKLLYIFYLFIYLKEIFEFKFIALNSKIKYNKYFNIEIQNMIFMASYAIILFLKSTINFIGEKYLFVVFIFIYFISRKIFIKYCIFKENIIFHIVLMISCLFPILIIICNELEYYLYNSHKITMNIYLEIFFIMLLVIFIFLFSYFKKIENYYYSISMVFIISMFLFYSYNSIININNIDSFHNGENLLPALQYFEFNKIPFINIFMAHGFSDSIMQYIYGTVNKFNNPLELWSWDFIYKGVQAYCILVFIKSFSKFDNFFVVMLILFTPFADSIFGSYFSYFLLYAVLVKKMYYNLTCKNIRVVLVYCFLGFFWRVDFGVVAYITTIIVTIMCFLNIIDKGYKIDNKKLKIVISNYFYINFVFIILFILICILGKENPIEVSLKFITFFKMQGDVQAYTRIFSEYNFQVLLVYAIYPLTCILYIVYFFINNFNKEMHKNSIQIFVVCMISLIMLLRSLQRHSLLEGYGVSVYILVPLAIIMILNINLKEKNTFNYLVQIFVSVFFISMTYSTPLVNHTKTININNWKVEKRLILNNNEYDDFIEFISKNTNHNETFYQFNETPYLNVCTKKEFIPYFIPNVYQGTDFIQNLEIKKLKYAYNQGKLKFIIFSNDGIDNVPTAIRNYKIAEFIYQNFMPFKNINGINIWKSKKGESNIDKETIIFKKNEFSKNVVLNDAKLIEDSEKNIFVKSGQEDPFIENLLLNENIKIDSLKNYKIRLNYDSDTKGVLQTFYALDENQYSESTTSFSNIDIGKALNIDIPINKKSIQSEIKNIRMDPPNTSIFKIRSLEIIEYNNLDYTPQKFDLILLPYYWGEYDSNEAIKKTLVLENLIINNPILITTEGLNLNLNEPNKLDKSTGNYIHLRAKASNDTNFTINYGIDEKSTITFKIVKSEDYKDYLVRISCQAEWFKSIDKLNLYSDGEVDVIDINIRKGD